MGGKITILGTNTLKIQNGNAVSNRFEYTCANNQIINGIATAPLSLRECFERFPNVAFIANMIGVTAMFSLPMSTSVGTGETAGVCPCPVFIDEDDDDNEQPLQTGFTGTVIGMPTKSKEHEKIIDLLGEEWTGCFWTDPYAIFSSNCPDVGPMYETYLRYRTASATFWHTPIDAPIKRQQFVESIKDLVEITVAGNLSQRPGDIVYVKCDNATGLVTDNEDNLPGESIKTGYYYIIRAKNIIKNDGAHTTTLSLSKCTNARFYPPYRGNKPYASVEDVPIYGTTDD